MRKQTPEVYRGNAPVANLPLHASTAFLEDWELQMLVKQVVKEYTPGPVSCNFCLDEEVGIVKKCLQ